MSQDEAKAFLPIGSNWKAQSAGSAITVTGDEAVAAARAGLAAAVRALKIGK